MLAVLSVAVTLESDGQRKWQSTQFWLCPVKAAGAKYTATTEIKISWPLENTLLCFMGEWLVKAKTWCVGILIQVQHGTLGTHLWAAEHCPTAPATPEEQSLSSTPGLHTFQPYPAGSPRAHSPTCLKALHWFHKHESWNPFRKAVLTSFLGRCQLLLPVQENLLPILQTINNISNWSASADSALIQAKRFTYICSKERHVAQLALKNPCAKPGESEQSFCRILVKILKESQQTPRTTWRRGQSPHLPCSASAHIICPGNQVNAWVFSTKMDHYRLCTRFLFIISAK